MTREEIIRLSMLQREMLEKAEREKAEKDRLLREKERQNTDLLNKVNELLAGQAEAQKSITEMAALIARQTKTISDLTEQLKRSNKNLFGRKSLKGTSKAKPETVKSRQEDKDDFDGTPGSLSSSETAPAGQSNDTPTGRTHRQLMATASAVYHTTISTCRMMGISAMEYLKKFFSRIVEGERDYTRLMPQTIGIK